MRKQSMARGFSILGAAGIINKVLGVLYVFILIRIFNMVDGLGNAGMGIYNKGYQIYLLVFVITNQGIPIAISKMVSERVELNRFEDAYRTFRVSSAMLIGLGFVMMVLLALLSTPLANLVGRPEAAWTVLALSPTMLFSSISSSYRGYFQGRSNMTPTGISQVLEQLVNSVLTLVFAYLMLQYGERYVQLHHSMYLDEVKAQFAKLSFAAAGGTVGTTLGALCSALYLSVIFRRHKQSMRREINRERAMLRSASPMPHRKLSNVSSFSVLAKQVLRLAFPITLGVAVVYVASLVDLSFTNQRLIVAGFNPLNAESLYGIFSTQYQKIINIPLAVASALAVTVLPRISAAASKKDNKELHKRINSAFRWAFLVTIPAAIGIATLARPILWMLFPDNINGPDMITSMNLLMIGAGVVVLIGITQVQTSVLQGLGKMHIPTLHMAAGLCLKIVVNYVLIAVPSINIVGAVYGSWACYILAIILNAFSIKRYTRVSINLRQNFAMPFCAGALMGATAWFLYGVLMGLSSTWNVSPYLKNMGVTVLVVGVAFAVYLGAMYFMKGRPKNFRSILFGDE